MTTTTDTLADTATRYVTDLMTAVMTQGGAATITRGQHPAGSADALTGTHATWPYVGIHTARRHVHVHTVPTSHGVVLFLVTDTGDVRCLPTWGVDARHFGGTVLALARALVTHLRVA